MLNVSGGLISGYAGFIAADVAGTGAVTVTGGTWSSASSLLVGQSGTGVLNVSGGTVISANGFVGMNPSGNGTVTVTSGTWSNVGDLTLAYGGSATMNVSGGRVVNDSGFLGYQGPAANVTVSGGMWENRDALYVGFDAAGTLTMTGGLVTVGGLLSQGVSGTIQLDAGGVIQIGTGSTGGTLGVSTLANNGTLIFNRSNASSYSGVVSGSGAVVKQGAGLLAFSGANSYAGLTTISGGTLALSNAGSIGTGGLNLGTTGNPGVFDLAALTAGTYSLPATGSLAGVGTLSGSGKTLAVQGSFLPGNSPGTVTLDTGFTLDLGNSGTSVFEITSPRYTPGSFDLVTGGGGVVFGGVLDLVFSGGAYAEGTNVLQLFDNTGGLSGSFWAVNATGLAAGQYATFDPATGSISIVPEPSAYVLISVAAGLVALTRSRRHAGRGRAAGSVARRGRVRPPAG